jgi:hypothetical protein
VIKADADARFAAVVWVTPTKNGPPQVQFKFRELGPDVQEDRAVREKVQEWLTKHDEEYCPTKLGLPPGCLAKELSKTSVELKGEEFEMRMYETNLGNWIADRALEALAQYGAQVAFINSGSLRLNQTLPAGALLTQRHVEELFAYDAPLKLLRMKGKTLQSVISRAVQNWKGGGHWLQISGFAYRHNPDNNEADNLMLLTPGRMRPIELEEDLCVVTTDYLVGGNDGYTMLRPKSENSANEDVTEAGYEYEGKSGADLKFLVEKKLRESGSEGIAPKIQCRIYNPRRPGSCRGVADDGTSQASHSSNNTDAPIRCGK